MILSCSWHRRRQTDLLWQKNFAIDRTVWVRMVWSWSYPILTMILNGSSTIRTVLVPICAGMPAGQWLILPMKKGSPKTGTAEFLTGAGVIRATINGLYVVSDMTEPKIIRDDIEAFGEKWWLIDSGVPHLVAVRDDIENFDLQQARELRQKYNANVNICKVDGDTMYVRTYERGVEDETLACGTGMVACFIRNHIWRERCLIRSGSIPRVVMNSM